MCICPEAPHPRPPGLIFQNCELVGSSYWQMLCLCQENVSQNLRVFEKKLARRRAYLVKKGNHVFYNEAKTFFLFKKGTL